MYEMQGPHGGLASRWPADSSAAGRSTRPHQPLRWPRKLQFPGASAIP